MDGRIPQTVRLQLPQSVESPGNSFLYTVFILPFRVSARVMPRVLWTLAARVLRAMLNAVS